jgi:hypothetical protein
MQQAFRSYHCFLNPSTFGWVISLFEICSKYLQSLKGQRVNERRWWYIVRWRILLSMTQPDHYNHYNHNKLKRTKTLYWWASSIRRKFTIFLGLTNYSKPHGLLDYHSIHVSDCHTEKKQNIARDQNTTKRPATCSAVSLLLNQIDVLSAQTGWNPQHVKQMSRKSNQVFGEDTYCFLQFNYSINSFWEIQCIRTASIAPTNSIPRCYD